MVTLSDANSWTHTWLIQDGDTWSVRELTQLTNFQTNYNVSEFATTIVNTHLTDREEPTPPGGNTPPGEEEGEVLGVEDITEPDVPLAALPEEEEGMVLGAEDEEGMVAGIADTGDSKAIIFAGAAMLAAVAGIVALRKKKED